MAEERLSILRAHTERFKHFLLQFRLMNSHAPAADLDAVEHDVVRFRPNFGKFLGIEKRRVLRLRTGEWMMDRVPFIFLGAPLHERKICYPQKIPVRAGVRARHGTSPSIWRTGPAISRSAMQILNLCDAQTNPSEHFAGNLPFVRAEENQIAFLDL